PLPPPVCRPAAAGAAPHRAGPGRRAAPGRREVARRARASGGGGPARPDGAGLGPGRAAAGRLLAWAVPGRAGRRHPRAARRVPRRSERGGCGAGGGGRGGWAGPRVAGGGRGGTLEAAGRYLALAERGMASVPEGRQGQAQLLVGMVRLLLARQRGDRSAVAEQARRLQAAAEAPEAAWPGLGEELRALALISL